MFPSIRRQWYWRGSVLAHAALGPAKQSACADACEVHWIKGGARYRFANIILEINDLNPADGVQTQFVRIRQPHSFQWSGRIVEVNEEPTGCNDRAGPHSSHFMWRSHDRWRYTKHAPHQGDLRVCTRSPRKNINMPTPQSPVTAADPTAFAALARQAASTAPSLSSAAFHLERCNK